MGGVPLWTPVHSREAHYTHHLVVAEHFEHALKEREFNQVRERVFAASDVNATSDSLALEWIK